MASSLSRWDFELVVFGWKCVKKSGIFGESSSNALCQFEELSEHFREIQWSINSNGPMQTSTETMICVAIQMKSIDKVFTMCGAHYWFNEFMQSAYVVFWVRFFPIHRHINLWMALRIYLVLVFSLSFNFCSSFFFLLSNTHVIRAAMLYFSIQRMLTLVFTQPPAISHPYTGIPMHIYMEWQR